MRDAAVRKLFHHDAGVVVLHDRAQADIGLMREQARADLLHHAIDHDQVQLGVALAELHQDVRQQGGRADVAHGDHDFAALQVGVFAAFLDGTVDSQDGAPRGVDHGLAVARQGDLAAAHHQRLADFGLQAADQVADRGLRQAQAFAGGREAGRFTDSDQRAQLAQGDGFDRLGHVATS
jgi:hypothetical protein